MTLNRIRLMLGLPMDAKNQLTALLALRLLGSERGGVWLQWMSNQLGNRRIAAAQEALDSGKPMSTVLRLTCLFEKTVIALIEASTGGDFPEVAIEYLTRTKFAVSAPDLHQKPVYLTPAGLIDDVLFHAIEVEETAKRVLYDRVLANKASLK